MKKIIPILSALVFLMLIAFSITAENIKQSYKSESQELKAESYISNTNQDLNNSSLMDYDSWSD